MIYTNYNFTWKIEPMKMSTEAFHWRTNPVGFNPTTFESLTLLPKRMNMIMLLPF